MALTPADITTFHSDDPPPGKDPWVDGAAPETGIAVVAPGSDWPAQFAWLVQRIRGALGMRALDVEHVGSTAVPGLPAKPVIDIDLTVADPSAEAEWLPPLEAAGFTLAIREPWWYEHRCLRHRDPRCNLHVFAPGTPELLRHKLFRDWLRQTPEDLAAYRDAKLAAADAANTAGEHVMEYNARKQAVVREIYGRAFRAAGLT